MQGKRNYLIIRNTGVTISQSVWLEVTSTIDNWGLAKYFSINKSTLTITCTLNNKQIIFRGLDDVQKIKSVRAKSGPITDILIEEATEIPSHKIFKELIKRQRGHSEVPKRITMLFNPIYQTHWIYRDFFAGFWKDGGEQYQSREGLSILKTTYSDNTHLTKDDVKDLENEQDPYFYNVYTLGNWGTLGHQVFKNWRIENLSGIVDTFDNIRNGIDWGFGSDPFAFIRVHYDKTRRRIYIFKALSREGLLNNEVVELIKPIIGNEIVTCDSAEPKSVAELRTYKINAKGAKKGAGSVEFGIKWLQQHEIIIQEGLTDVVNEFVLYRFKEDRNGVVLPIPIDAFNHYIDALRYALESDMVENKWGW
jgi:phage terminase large subunit